MRVLVVEDEKKVAAAVRRGLEAEGFAVDVALTGTDGLWMATENPYDAIVLDIMLPGMNGYRVCAELRAKGSDTPILMLTAKDGEFDEAEALDTGADDYLSKPFSFVVLVARLRALIRRSGGRTLNDITIGRLVLQPAARGCTIDGEPVALTAREYALVEFLALHRGEVVTRSSLLDHLLDEGEDTLSNLLDVHVSNLRKKLGAGFVTTHRGLGYSIE